MPYDLSFQVRPDYVEAQLTVEITPGQELKEAMQRWEAVARICRENNLNKVLVVMTFSGSYGMETKFQLARGGLPPSVGARTSSWPWSSRTLYSTTNSSLRKPP